MTKYIYLLLLLVSTLKGISQEPFSLQGATEYAVLKSLTLKEKALDIKSAEEDINGLKSIALPQVNGTINYQHYFAVPAQPIADFITPSIYGVLFAENLLAQRDLGPPSFSKISFFQPNNIVAATDANLLLYDGAYRYGLKASRIYRDLTQKQVNATEYEVKSMVRKAYLNALIADENLKILDKNITVLTKSLNDIKAMYEAGFAESLDVERLQVSHDNLKTQRDAISEMKKLGINLLKFQMGYPSDGEITLTEKLEELVKGYLIPNLADDFDISMRPEFQVIEAGAKLNEIDQLRIKAAYLPTLRAFVNLQASLFRGNLFDSNQSGWIPASSAGLALNIPIYDGGSKKSQLAKSRIAGEKIVIQKQAFEQVVALQINNAKTAINSAIKTLESRKKTLAAAQGIYDKVNIKFVEGVGSSVELIQAEGALFEAQALYINAMYDVAVAKADLDIALAKL